MPRRRSRTTDGCTPGYTDTAASSGGTGMGPGDATKSTIGPNAKQYDQAEQDRQARNERNGFIRRFVAAFQNKYYGTTLTASDYAKARKAAADTHRETARLIESMADERQRRFEDVIKLVQGTASTVGTFWTNLKNRIYGAFVNDRAELIKFISHYAADKDIPEAYRYKLVQMFERIQPTARSFEAQFKRRREDLLREFIPVFNRVGLSMEDGAYVLGIYAAARHTPERNAFLLGRWKALVAEAQRNGSPDASDGVPVAIYQRQIRLLEDNLENVEPVFANGSDEKLYRSAGWTNAGARQKMDELLQKYGFTREEADNFATRLTQEYDFILKERARNGTLDKNLTIPNFMYYVPMVSKRGTNLGNYVSTGNDATPYNPGSYYAALGRNDPPESAWVSLQFYSNKAATEIATRDFGFALYAIKRHLDKTLGEGVSGLASIKYSDLMRQIQSNTLMGEALHQMYNGGGFVALIPQADGSLKREFLWFRGANYSHNGTDFDIVRLNQALSSSFRFADPGPIVGAASTATSFMGQLTTRYTPLFAPISGTRDFMERTFHILNRTYNKEGGGYVGGLSVATDFLKNVSMAGRILYQGMRGQLDADSEAGRLYQEFLDNGLAQKFAQRTQVRDNSLERIDERRVGRQGRVAQALEKHLGLDNAKMQAVLNTMGGSRESVVRVIDGWNDYFQNIAAFDHFYTLRKNGVSVRDAASGALELMNMAQRGRVTPWLQALAPFITPTVQSGTALARSLGLGANSAKGILKSGKKGYGALIGAFAAYNILMPLAKESLGKDENGNSRFDSLSLDEVTRALPIGIGGDGDYVRFPIGFGFPQLGAMLAVGLDRVSEGRMTLPDLMFELNFTALKNFAPGNWAQFNFTENPSQYLMSLLTPSPLRPIQEVAANTNFFGNELYVTPRDPYQSKAELGRTSTPRPFHSQARWMRDTFGIDQQPEVFEHMERGYALGPFKALISLAAQSDDIYKGSNRPSALDSMMWPLAALGMSSWMGKQANPARSLFYEAQRYYANRIRMEGLHMAAPRGTDPEAYRREVLTQAGWQPEEVEDYIHIWQAEKLLRQQGSEFNEQYKDAWDRHDTSRELKEAFDRLGDENTSVYAATVDLLNYYGRGGRA